jgi:hypothetical protein
MSSLLAVVVVPNVTLYLDDEPIMKDGRLLIAEIPK